MRNRAAEAVNALLKTAGLRLSIDRPLRDPIALFRLKAEEAAVGTVLDVGANRGQFAGDLRRAGWTGRIVSFEPTSAAHAALAALAARDEGWIAAPRMALGAGEGEAEINLSINSVSSSLLKVDARSIEAAPESAFTSSERVPVRTLDAVVETGWARPFALKIDTQGFELEVLRGAAATLAQTAIVSLELSLAPLYENGASFVAVYGLLEQAGFHCIALSEVFCDFARNEVLQVDGTFVRGRETG